MISTKELGVCLGALLDDICMKMLSLSPAVSTISEQIFFFFFFFFLSRTGLLRSVASPAAMWVKKWSRSMPRVLLKQLKTGADVVKTIDMILVFMERWGPAAGCGGCSLVDSGRTQVKGLKK